MAQKRSRIVVDDERVKMLRDAWDLLLSDNFTLKQICKELHDRGYTRRSGKPWIWTDKETGIVKDASSQLHLTFHNPFYAGWVTSLEYGIKRGDKRGHWEPIVTEEEFDRGVTILKKHDEGRARIKRHVYLLTGLLQMHVESNGKKYSCNLSGSTPTGRRRSYSYYVISQSVDGIKYSIRMDKVESQITELLSGIQVAPESIPAIRSLYKQHMSKLKGPDANDMLLNLQKRLEQHKAKEADLVRLFLGGDLTDDTYKLVYREWQDKQFEMHNRIRELQTDTKRIIDDLDLALTLMAYAHRLFERLDRKQQRKLLQILFKHIIIDTRGTITSIELHSPFVYLAGLTTPSNEGVEPKIKGLSGSSQIQSQEPFVARPN